MSTKRTKKTDDDGDVSKTFRSAIRHDIVGLLEAWASGADPSWLSFKAEWKAREMSLLHHAPFRVNNPPRPRRRSKKASRACDARRGAGAKVPYLQHIPGGLC